ncbi:glutathione synthase/ribosomal protein S6 modification protein [Mycobacterium tuberculosis]|nr:glutathione synthase/ribosomal protein S6 modification protein [Mycobacterium tuberculosis]
MTIAFATCSWLPAGSDEVRDLIAALAPLGIEAEPVVWDGDADWSRYDLVVIRSTWDYTSRRDQYVAWAESLPRVLNPAEIVRWNTDKRYLRDLAAAGLPVVPTLWDPDEIPSAWPEYVIKPAVSIGSGDTARWGPGEDERARAHLRSLREAGRTVMVQPYLSAVDSAGETALVFCDGEYSHAGRKAQILTAGAGVQGSVRGDATRGQVTAAAATEAELDVATRALAAVPGGGDLLYARVDLVPGPDGDPMIIELELTEPNLYLQHGPGSARRFAKAIAARL